MNHFWIVGTATTLRAAAAYTLFAIGATIAQLSLHLLPKDHPGRIYGVGRLCEGRKRISEGLSKSAADRYISTRRRSRYL